MKKLIIWGTGTVGCRAYNELKGKYDIVGWGDNDKYKQGTRFYNLPVMSAKDIIRDYKDVNLCIAISNYYEVAKELFDIGLNIEGYFAEDNTICDWRKASWENVLETDFSFLYAGDLDHRRRNQFPEKGFLCLSIMRENEYTLLHDIRNKFPLEGDSIDLFQAEDVLEHIEINYIQNIIKEVYRILKKGGIFRISLPDYYSPIVRYYSFISQDDSIVFDPHGGGSFIEGDIKDGGHIWYPNIDMFGNIVSKSEFKKVIWYRYHRKDGSLFRRPIDHTIGYIERCEEHIVYHQDISIVCDLIK